MKVERRKVFGSEFIILVCESERETALIDTLGYDFAKNESCPVNGEIRLADGYGECYILLRPARQDTKDGAKTSANK